MNLRTLLRTAALLLALPLAAQAQELKLGLLPRLSATELTTMFRPLADHLARETGQKVTLVIPKDFDAFEKAVQNGEVDLAFSNPLVYVQLKKGKDLAPLAVAVEKKGGTKFRGKFLEAVNAAGGCDDSGAGGCEPSRDGGAEPATRPGDEDSFWLAAHDDAMVVR